MNATALVIGAVNLVLKRLGDLPEGPEVTSLQERALGYIDEVAMWTAERPSLEVREATMKNVLALHIAVTKLRMESSRAEDEVALRLGPPS